MKTEVDKFIQKLKERMSLEHEEAVAYHQKLLNGEVPWPKMLGLSEQLETSQEECKTDPTTDGQIER